MAENLWKCPFCPCRFFNKSDYDRHLDYFGRDERHITRWYDEMKKRQYEGWLNDAV